MNDFIILCAPTNRTQAYLQAIHAAGFTPRRVIVYGNAYPRNTTHDRRGHHLPIFQPDFNIPLEKTIQDADWSVNFLDDDNIGSEDLVTTLAQQQPSLTVFSGFGGQLVPSETLKAAGRLLHIHSGWLPDYRGSTTLYYSLLQEQRCAASALLLSEAIDNGPLLARQYYPVPDQQTDIDYAYDSAIRADLLVQVLQYYLDNGQLPEIIKETSTSEMFYVIHPLLKHLAITSLNES